MNANYITLNRENITALINALQSCGSDHVRVESGYLGNSIHGAEFRTYDERFIAIVYNEKNGEWVETNESETSPEIPFPARFNPLRTSDVPTTHIVDALRRCKQTALIALAGDRRPLAVAPYEGTAVKYTAMQLCVDLWLAITDDAIDIASSGRTMEQKIDVTVNEGQMT